MVYLFDNKEKHFIYKHLSDLHSNKYHSKYYVDVGLGDMHYKCNISISRGVSTEDQEDWYIVSNISPNQAIRAYSKRFGCIEMFSSLKKRMVSILNQQKQKTYMLSKQFML